MEARTSLSHTLDARRRPVRPAGTLQFTPLPPGQGARVLVVVVVVEFRKIQHLMSIKVQYESFHGMSRPLRWQQTNFPALF